MSDRELYHDGAKCPYCWKRLGTPRLPEDVVPGDFPASLDPTAMMCASCGLLWRELEAREIARAWFALGAYEQSLRAGAEPRQDATEPDQMELF